MSFEDTDGSTTAGHGARHREADHTAPDDGHIDAFHEATTLTAHCVMRE